MKKGFDNDKYLSMQSQHIRERINKFDNKLYLEFGGKLFDDYHASRVLPGFQPDSKLRLLKELSDQAEIVIVISALDIVKNKVRGDLGISYHEDVLRLRDAFQNNGLFVGSVAITQYAGQDSADQFKMRLEKLGIKVYLLYNIEGYPTNITHIVSENGYGKNDYIETTRPLVVITAPGPGSGKMATCLSQLYHEHQRGISAGYAKFETFPIWNLPLKHPVNLAYEAATADLNDLNMIDPFHLEAYGKTTVNYNRDIEIFPVLGAIFEQIYGENPYKSPTDMGVNMAGNSICDDEVCREASKQEIIRRYYTIQAGLLEGNSTENEVFKLELLMKQAGITPESRTVVSHALNYRKEIGTVCAAIELHDGRLVTGKQTTSLCASAGLVLNALKVLAGVPQEEKIIAPSAIAPIQELKTGYLGGNVPELHIDETLIALSISASSNNSALLALAQLPRLSGCQVHLTAMPAPVDYQLFQKLGIQVTSEANHETNHLTI